MADVFAMVDGSTLKLYALNGAESADLVASIRLKRPEPSVVGAILAGLRPHLDLEPAAAPKAIPAKATRAPREGPHRDLIAWQWMGKRQRRLSDGRLTSGWGVSVIAALGINPDAWLSSRDLIALMGVTRQQWRDHASVVSGLQQRGYVEGRGNRSARRYRLGRGVPLAPEEDHGDDQAPEPE